jgi:hypothetical protein
MASSKRRILVSRKVSAHAGPQGHKRITLRQTNIHLGHEPFSPTHRTPGHDAMGGSRAPPG